MEVLNAFLSGGFVVACAAVALFFRRYWKRSRDRLFLHLALAFVLLGLERSVLAFVPMAHEGRHFVFLARLVAFALIIVAVVDKNRPRRS